MSCIQTFTFSTNKYVSATLLFFNFWQFLKFQMAILLKKAKNIGSFFLDFEGSRMSPRKSAKNEENGAHGLNSIIFVNFKLIFEIYDKNYSRKKFLSLRHF